MRAFSPAQPPSNRSAVILGGSFDAGAVSNLEARYLDDGAPYHTGPTASKYYVRDSSGNDLHAEVKTSCLRNAAATSNTVSIGTFQLDADFEISFHVKYEGSNSVGTGPMFFGGGDQSLGASYKSYLWYRPSTGIWYLDLDGPANKITSSANTVLEDNKWHFVQVTRVSTVYRILVDGVQIATNTTTVSRLTIRNILQTYASNYSVHGMMADLKINNAGLITHFPIQEGKGTDLCWSRSDGTSGVVSSAIIGGTESDWWAAKCPGYAKDWSIEYGGRIAASGAFIIGNTADGNCADGNAKTLSAGKHGNPFSSINLNPNWTDALKARAIPSEFKPGQQLNDQVSPFNCAFSRVSSDGTDRLLVYSDAKTGATLSGLRSYCGVSAPGVWTLDSLPGEIVAEYIAAISANSGTISTDNETAVGNLLTGLNTAGLFDDVLCLYLFHGGVLTSARLNAMNPTTVMGSGVITWVGTPTISSSGRMTPSSGNYGKACNPGYMGLNFFNSFGGAGLGFYSSSNAATSERTIGNINALYLAPKYSGTSEIAISNGTPLTGTVQDLSGFHFATREPGTDTIVAYRNGSSYLTGSRSFAQGYTTQSDAGILHIGGCNNDGAGNLTSTTPLDLGILTRGLISAQVASLNTLVQAYISELV